MSEMKIANTTLNAPKERHFVIITNSTYGEDDGWGNVNIRDKMNYSWTLDKETWISNIEYLTKEGRSFMAFECNPATVKMTVSVEIKV